jgi:hypothetical protein
LNARGRLSEGIHDCTLAEVEAVFGWNARRRQLLQRMTNAFHDLHAMGCPRVWLDGSYVTDKPEPGDYDAVYEHSGMDQAALKVALPELFDRAAGRPQMKARFGGDLFPNVVEAASSRLFVDFFQLDRDYPGERKGIVTIDLQMEFTS